MWAKMCLIFILAGFCFGTGSGGGGGGVAPPQQTTSSPTTTGPPPTTQGPTTTGPPPTTQGPTTTGSPTNTSGPTTATQGSVVAAGSSTKSPSSAGLVKTPWPLKIIGSIGFIVFAIQKAF